MHWKIWNWKRTKFTKRNTGRPKVEYPVAVEFEEEITSDNREAIASRVTSHDPFCLALNDKFVNGDLAHDELENLIIELSCKKKTKSQVSQWDIWVGWTCIGWSQVDVRV